MSPIRRFLLATLTAALLVGCGQDHAGHSSGGSSGDTGPRPNAADVTFVQNMIPHHQQAIDMARLVPSRTARRELQALAANIVKTQGQELALMSGWVRAWGRQPADDHSSQGHGQGVGPSRPA